MDPDVAFRPARPEDYPGIDRLAGWMDRLHREHLPDRFREPDGPNRTREYVESLIADEDTCLTVAESKDEIVGIINAGLSWTPDIRVKKPRRFVKVRGIVVEPRMRRRGIGRALMHHVEQWGNDRNAREIQLNVYDYNQDARAFFVALGFTPLSRRLVRALGRKG